MESSVALDPPNDILSDDQIYELLRNAERSRRGQVLASTQQNAIHSTHR